MNGGGGGKTRENAHLSRADRHVSEWMLRLYFFFQGGCRGRGAPWTILLVMERTVSQATQAKLAHLKHNAFQAPQGLRPSHEKADLRHHPEALVVQEAHGGDAQIHSCLKVLGRA